MTPSESKSITSSHFYRLQGLRRRVFLTQLPLSLLMVVSVIIALAFYPQSFRETLFVTSLVLHVLLLLAAILVPWDRLPRGSFLIIPYLDFVAIGLFRGGNYQFLTAVGLMIFFPVFWLAASGMAKRTAVSVSVVGALLIVWVPIFAESGTPTLEQLAKPLLFPLVVFAFATTVAAVTNTMNVQRKTLQAKDRQLRDALAASQQRERLLSTILDTVAVGVVVVDAGGHDVLMNATQNILHSHALPEGIADPAEGDLLVFNQDGITPVPTEERPVLRAIHAEEFTNYQLWLGSGETARAVSTASRVMVNEQGEFDGAVVAFHDITDMMSALSAKNDFVSNVSHEFRTPLTSIQGYLDMALEEPAELPPHVEKYLTIAVRNVDRLNSLVEDLLSTDSVTLNVARVDVAQLVADSLGTAAPVAHANKVALSTQVQAPLEAFVDALRVGQVLDNLVSNAVKYSPDGGTVTVRAWAQGSDLWCEVKDTGMGMNSADQAEAFTKFFRAKSAMQRSIPGIGLGLMISKAIISKHGGTIELRSERGLGTSLIFVLPGCVVTGPATTALDLTAVLSDS
ncbi:sensor histidine kinase [Arthrobacter psychrochitiniphilus]|uniref:histidine kinase n=1 Tax=Arthrobacter psychrochitiniphilus TaxID=291045 RepID=A0A2V3DWP3_9MICC|nr:ATP-binding protein [Arthrobacter psychrochitiniphilus]NYG16598.1 signal transduction histidine kinase [Arthrobacter psychrochitiniphilus]PXA69285.1 two-component sensor histidine kinase [Arthrobacter psychrochitiniphilus]